MSVEGRRRVNIMVVEDVAGIREICERTLRGAGFSVSCFESGDEAVERLDEDWDIVLTDISMPGSISGIDLCRRARAAGSMDVIVMTAFPEIETAVEALRQGAYDYLIKPFTTATLLAAVRRCAEKRQLSSELAREKVLRVELENANRVREVFGQFVTPQIAKWVLSGQSRVTASGTRQVVTMLFSDVRKFTPFASQVSPEEAVTALNEVLSCQIEAIQREGGTVNKFIGDGLLAFFGAPIPMPPAEQAYAAARAALAAQAAVQALGESRKSRNLLPLQIGIGINTGEVVAGFLGTKDRTEYSVIGHAVNLAARLEEAACSGETLLGPETTGLLSGQFQLGEPDFFEFPGVYDPVRVVRLLGEAMSDMGGVRRA